ncbi:hypothetical protein FFLO_06348 [Filobasidium floriforme]|uniref:Uncharacterized protein n=1 Tax=Filobasidium floriforme TaxID=5210 RepID=A0A8K0JFC8_9TREE|nr:hypothetical protein FFLO_06348 [Filobasidium floriforme]
MFTRSFPALQKVLPSRRLVAQDIDTVFTVNAERLKRAFAAYVGVFHIAIDGWTDRRGNKFVGIYAHWTPMDDNGTSVSPSSCLIDFVP